MRLYFPHCALACEYRAERTIAHRMAADLRDIGVQVTIDSALREGLAPMPCTRLWAW